MLGSPLKSNMNEKVNIEAINLYIYKEYFLLEPNMKITGMTSMLRIDRKTQDIVQLSRDEPIKSGYDKKQSYCAILGILPVLSKHYLIFAEYCSRVCIIEEKDVFEIKDIAYVQFEPEDVLLRDEEGKLHQKSFKLNQQSIESISYLDYLKNYLMMEGYYFAFRYDLSLSRESYSHGCPSKKKFIWNVHMGKLFQKLNDRKWFLKLIQGSIKSFKITLQGTKVEYILITRRSWTKGGTRFNSRGIDMKGNVANFCQTQQLIFINNLCFSHLQIRGSVPMFWKQTGLKAEVEFYKNSQENEESFEKHFKKLIRNYQNILSINLLCIHKDGEIDLTLYYEKLVQKKEIKGLKYEYFDVHCASSGQRFQKCNYLIDKIHEINTQFKYYTENLKQSKVTSTQNGVIRVNCLDNLDRTNLIQSKIAYEVLTRILVRCGFKLQSMLGSNSIVTAADNSLNENMLIIYLKNVWADNGDMISKHYTGTGSTHSNVSRTGRRDFKGLVDHGFKSCKRLYQQYMEDNRKQEVIDILIGEHTETINLTEFQARLKDLHEADPEDKQMTDPQMTSDQEDKHMQSSDVTLSNHHTQDD